MIVKPHRNREKAERLYQQYFICSDKRKEKRGAFKLTTTTCISTLEGGQMLPISVALGTGEQGTGKPLELQPSSNNLRIKVGTACLISHQVSSSVFETLVGIF